MYQAAEFQRTVIIGNGGSGKSWYWVWNYRVRDNADSHGGHARIFTAFIGKVMLRLRQDMAVLLEQVAASRGGTA